MLHLGIFFLLDIFSSFLHSGAWGGERMKGPEELWGWIQPCSRSCRTLPAAGERQRRERERWGDSLNSWGRSDRLLSPLIWFKLSHLVTLNGELSQLLLLLSLWEQWPEGRGNAGGLHPWPWPRGKCGCHRDGHHLPFGVPGKLEPLTWDDHSPAPPALEEGLELVSNPSNQAERGVPSLSGVLGSPFPGSSTRSRDQSSHGDAAARRKGGGQFTRTEGLEQSWGRAA